MNEPPTYISFLVRLWQEAGQGRLVPPRDWQGEIECIQTGQRRTFATLEELLGFLRRLGEQPETWHGWVEK
jgi:hypothetical protein